MDATCRGSRPMLAAAALLLSGCTSAPTDAPQAAERLGDLAAAAPGDGCAPGARTGSAGASDGLLTPDGVRYSVRTPSAYDPTRAHPLIVVFAPLGATARKSEAFVELTPAATARGFVVAYADHRGPLSSGTYRGLAGVPRDVAARWCIDGHRVYATGHSDGGTVATAIALAAPTQGLFAAIAPSASGFSQSSLALHACPAPMPVMVLHGRGDQVFPGWGAEAARWWATCNGCEAAQRPSDPAGPCKAFRGCRAATLYCEGEGGHRDWPGLQDEIVRFFEAAGRAQR